MMTSTASAQQGSVMGTWLTASGKAQVRIGPCSDPKSGPICGYIVGLNNPTGPDGTVVSPEVATDWRNGWGFKKTADRNTFEGGQIYNGENGKIYNANISLQPDGKLSLRGYVGIPTFGETQTWTRVN